MKNNFLSIFVVFLLWFLLVSCVTVNNKNENLPISHVGKWSGVLKDNKKIILILDNDGYAKLSIDEKYINPNESLKDIVYVIDFNAKPVDLDIIFMNPKRESIVYKMVIEFLSPDLMRVSTFFNNIRPEKIDNENSFVLRKKFF